MGSHREYRERKYEFGKQLLTLRTKAALTQVQIAEQLGVHRRSVQNWETSESYPRAELLQRLIAVFVRYHAFAKESEHEEAQALWNQATEDGPHSLATFDEVWFSRMLSVSAALPPGSVQSEEHVTVLPVPQVTELRTILDWGEAIDVPALYGRDRELETLQRWVVDDTCRAITILGIGGIGKSSLAIVLANRVLPQFDLVLFRSLQNGPPLTEVLDQIICAIADQQTIVPADVSDKIALLVRLFREQRCLLVLDNLESIMQSGALTGTYRTGYDNYGSLLQRLSEREHHSCLLLTSREKPAELGPLEGRDTPVRTLQLTGLVDSACRIILKAKSIVGTASDLRALVRLYGGNPLALILVAEPIRELFGSDVGAFLAAGDAFFNGVGKLLGQQFARLTPLEQTLLRWLAIERELVPLNTLLISLGDTVSQREVLVAFQSLQHRMLVERARDRPAFTLQPIILEYVTDQLVGSACSEIVHGQPQLLQRHALVQATAKEYIRRSQERLIAMPLLEQLASSYGGTNAVGHQLIALLNYWRDQPLSAQGYGPGNVVDLLRLLHGHLRGHDFARLFIRQAYLQNVGMQDTRLTDAAIQDSVFTENFDIMTAVAISGSGAYWAAGSRRGDIRVWRAGGLTLHRMWRAHAYEITAGSFMFSADEQTLASGSADGTIKLWDVATGALRWSGTQVGVVYHLALSPDGSMLASLASGGNPEATLWNFPSGKQADPLSHPLSVSSVAWNPDGHLLATGDVEGCIRVWQISKTSRGTFVRTLTEHTHAVVKLAFSPDGNTLASASWDGTVKLWDMATDRPPQTLAGHTDRVNRIVWSPDGHTLASGSRDCTIRLWDVDKGRYRAVLQEHRGELWGLAFTPDSRSLLSSSEDGTLRVWDGAIGQCTRVTQGYAISLYDVDWSPDGSHIVHGSSDASMAVWNLAIMSITQCDFRCMYY